MPAYIASLSTVREGTMRFIQQLVLGLLTFMISIGLGWAGLGW